MGGSQGEKSESSKGRSKETSPKGVLGINSFRAHRQHRNLSGCHKHNCLYESIPSVTRDAL